MLAACCVAVAATPRTTSAALSLALAHRDYPKGVKVTALPATNAVADTYFGPVHRSAFDELGRIDGEGWIQAGIWHFRTGRGRVVRNHRTVFGYGIHAFKGARGATRALHDVKLKTRALRVAHIWTRYYHVSDVRSTLVFDFFAIGPVEVEAYYQYAGVAPAKLQASLRHTFSTQNSHLVALARRYSKALRAHPTAVPTDTPIPTDTPTAAATDTPAAIPTPTFTATPIPSPTLTPRPTNTSTPTPTPTPAGLVLSAAPVQPSYAPGDLAAITVHVMYNGSPVANALVNVDFYFTGSSQTCVAHSDANGVATCSTLVPQESPGTTVTELIQVTLPTGETGRTSTSFTVK